MKRKNKIIKYIIYLIYIILLCCIAVLGSNQTEIAFDKKSDILKRINSCPVIQQNQYVSGTGTYVIKPETLCGKVGVGLQSKEWTIDICQSEFGVECMKQWYHAGPYEIRLCKDGVYGWKKPFVFVAGWKYTDWIDPPHFEIETNLNNLNNLNIISYLYSIQSCIDSVFPDTQFVSVDIRANNDEFLILEINGGMGIGFEWVDNFNINWLFSLIQSGIFSLRGISRICQAIYKMTQRQCLIKKWEFENI